MTFTMRTCGSTPSAAHLYTAAGQTPRSCATWRTVRSCSIGGSKLVAKSLRIVVDACDPWTAGWDDDLNDSVELGRLDDGCAASGGPWGASGRWFKSSRPDHWRPLIFREFPGRSGASSFGE